MPISVERLPAERTATMPVAAAAGGCCSCCCCCFHTVGSLIGAAMAKPKKLPELETPVATIAGTPTEPKYSAYREYWMAFLVASVILVMGFGIWLDGSDKLAGTVILYAIFVPAVQLAASLGAFVMILTSKRPGQSERLGHLGRITAYALLGTLLGALVVWAIFQR